MSPGPVGPGNVPLAPQQQPHFRLGSRSFPPQHPHPPGPGRGRGGNQPPAQLSPGFPAGLAERLRARGLALPSPAQEVRHVVKEPVVKLTEQQLMICPKYVRGYSLKLKQWRTSCSQYVLFWPEF